MKFKQFEDGSCDIEFTWRERFILFKKGKLGLKLISISQITQLNVK
jgi:hypothetical protein